MNRFDLKHFTFISEHGDDYANDNCGEYTRLSLLDWMGGYTDNNTPSHRTEPRYAEKLERLRALYKNEDTFTRLRSLYTSDDGPPPIRPLAGMHCVDYTSGWTGNWGAPRPIFPLQEESSFGTRILTSGEIANANRLKVEALERAEKESAKEQRRAERRTHSLLEIADDPVQPDKDRIAASFLPKPTTMGKKNGNKKVNKKKKKNK